MNTQEILQRVFPAGAVSLRSYGFEVNGLPKGTVPAVGEVLAQGQEKHSRGDRREHYLLRSEGVLVFFRICTAMEDSGYAEFVAGRTIAISDDDQAELETYARSWIADMTTPSKGISQ